MFDACMEGVSAVTPLQNRTHHSSIIYYYYSFFNYV